MKIDNLALSDILVDLERGAIFDEENKVLYSPIALLRCKLAVPIITELIRNNKIERLTEENRMALVRQAVGLVTDLLDWNA